MNVWMLSGVFKDKYKLFEYVLLIFLAITSIAIVLWALAYCYYGFDITDEGSYLVWISNPFIYDYSVTQFGFVYHPLYQLVGGDIILLRQANVLITYGLGFMLACALLNQTAPEAIQSRFKRNIISAGFATTSLLALIIAGGWFPTPSYNTLVTQSLLLVATGVFWAEANYSRLSLAGWALIGLGGWLAFMAKPTTAAMLAVCVAVYLLMSWRLRARTVLLTLAIVFALLVVSSLAIDGSLGKSLDRLQGGLQFADYSNAGYGFGEMFRLGKVQLNGLEKQAFIYLTLSIFIIIFCVYSKFATIRLTGLALITALFLFALGVVFGFWKINVSIGQFQDLLILSIPFAGILFVLVARGRHIIYDIHYSDWLRVIVFITVPYIYVFGSNNNYWSASSPASYFWVISGLILVAKATPRERALLVLGTFVLVTQVFVILRMQIGSEHPYRQPQALSLNNYEIELGAAKSKLLLAKDYGKYLESAIVAIKTAGFKSNTPVIDLGGQSPGLLYAINAISIGQPWMIGGYPGSLKLAGATLDSVPCDQLVRAWLLVEPDGPRSISADLLKVFGGDFAKDYQKVASWETSEGAGGYKERRKQQLFKPLREPFEAERECDKLKY